MYLGRAILLLPLVTVVTAVHPGSYPWPTDGKTVEIDLVSTSSFSLISCILSEFGMKLQRNV